MTGSSLEQESDSCEITFLGSGASLCFNILLEGEIACTELLLRFISSIKVFALTFRFDLFLLSEVKYSTQSDFTQVILIRITNNMSSEIGQQTASHEPESATRWT